jgi:hypothetical protein
MTWGNSSACAYRWALRQDPTAGPDDAVEFSVIRAVVAAKGGFHSSERRLKRHDLEVQVVPFFGSRKLRWKVPSGGTDSIFQARDDKIVSSQQRCSCQFGTWDCPLRSHPG